MSHFFSRVDLAQLVKFLVVKLIHLVLNTRFDLGVAFTANYFSVGDDVPIDSEALLMTNFVNLKIKLTQSFGYDHKNKMCVRVFM
jgi:hypothetical protein